MKKELLPLFFIAISMLSLDMLWLGIMVKRFYEPNIGHLMSGSVKIVPAIFFYLIFVGGLYFFVVSPALSQQQGLIQVLITGALFGLITYGTYDLTNHATLRDWPAIVTVVDMAWGSTIAAAVSAFSVTLSRFFTA